jgi:uncharacterized membrane protein
MKRINSSFLIKISTLIVILFISILIKNYHPNHFFSQTSKKTMKIPSISKEWMDVILK